MKTKIFQKIKKYFMLEPLIILWILPSCFNDVAIQKLALEKACRVNLNFNEEICKNMLEINSIECEGIDYSMVNITDLLYDINDQHEMFNFAVCYSEIESQKLITLSNGIRTPIASIVPIIVILFAGGWSDRHNLRKPCMLFPMIGEVLGQISLLISSIFFHTLPMEFANILERVLPSLFGGPNLLIMGVYSYLIAITEEKDRTFRIGIFGMCNSLTPLIALPFSGKMYTSLGYIKLFALGNFVLLLGTLYLIYFLEEVAEIKTIQSSEKKLEKNGIDNIGFMDIEMDKDKKIPAKLVKKNKILEFFDPTLAYGCIEVCLKKRDGNGRLFIILLPIFYVFMIGPTLGELDYLFQFAHLKLHWTDDVYSVFNTYSTAISLVGTFIMTSVFSKVLGMTDSMVGIISSILTAISRPIFAFSNSLVSFYIARTVDMCTNAKMIALKTVISSFVELEELGRLYAILGIFEALSGVIFPPIYSVIYTATLDSFPGAYFLFGDIFFIPTAILFTVCYFVLKPKPTEIKDVDVISKNEKLDSVEESYL